MIWIVSGACRGVGKTRLCRRLAAVLPGAVYAKTGIHPRRPRGAKHYFTRPSDCAAFIDRLDGTRHAVVESNDPALLARGDLRIYLGAPPGTPDVRPDAADLEAAAEIAVTPGADPAPWRDRLAARLGDPELAGAAYATLLDQQAYLDRRTTPRRRRTRKEAGR
jgi:hypothetical protein